LEEAARLDRFKSHIISETVLEELPMRILLVLAALASMALPAVSQAAQSCALPISKIVGTNDYFKQNMTVSTDSTPGSLSLIHNDDPRIVVNFTLDTPASSEGYSRSQYVKHYESEASEYVAAQNQAGHAAEFAVFPFEPIAWRVVESTNVQDIGIAHQGKMMIRLTENCLLNASFFAPDSAALRTRYYALTAALQSLRDTSSPFVQTTVWEREDTSPKGILGLAVGYLAPLLVIGVLYRSLSHFSRFDVPSVATKTVLGSAVAISLGAVLYQRGGVFLDASGSMRYAETLLMLLTCAVTSVAALFLAQRATLLALVTITVTGASLIASSLLGWSADTVVTGAVGASLFIIGALGFASWSFPYLFDGQE
jgi:hypothetical protein